MSRVMCIIIALLVLVSGAVSAHAPTKVDLTYDQKTQILTIEFEHKVRDSNGHFIELVKVKLNKEDLIEQKLSIQDNDNNGKLVYRINQVKTGDTIEVRLNCVKGGIKTGKIVIK